MLPINRSAPCLLQFPFKQTFSHAAASHAKSASVLFVLEAEDGTIGFGEACPREYVTGEGLEETLASLNQLNFKGFAVPAMEEFLASPEQFIPNIQNAARCAVELAWLDLIAKHAKLELKQAFGPSFFQEIAYSAVLPLLSMKNAESLLLRTKDQGFSQVKIKLNNDLESTKWLSKLARGVLGDQVEIRVDANGAWTPAESLQQFAILADQGIFLVEQPLPVERIEELPQLRKAKPREIQLIADDEICDLASAQKLLRTKSSDRFQLKISKMGGILRTLEIAAFAAAEGIPCHLGCHVGESSLLSAVGRIFASKQILASVEGSYGPLILEEDLADPSLGFGKGGIGKLEDLQGNGWGLNMDLERWQWELGWKD